MCKKLLLVILFLFSTMHGMEIFQDKHKDLLKKIFVYTMRAEVEKLEVWKFGQPLPERKNDLWERIKRTYALQLVSKYFKNAFWDCFTIVEKNVVIQSLLRLHQKSSSDLVDIAVSMQASLYYLLRHALCEKYNPACVRAIVAIGDADVINQVGNGIIDRFDYELLHTLKTPLYLAIEMRRTDSAKLLLDYPMIDVNTTFPLKEAVNKENIEIVKLLLARSDIQIDDTITYLLDEAVRKENVEIVKLLLAHPNIQINTVNEKGETVLFVAAVASVSTYSHFPKNSLYCIITLLIQAGIDTTVKNKNGYTASDIACWQVRKMIKQALAAKNKI